MKTAFVISLALLALLPAFLAETSMEDDEMEGKELIRERRQRCPTVTFPCSRMRSVCANMRFAIFVLRKPSRLTRITSRARIIANRFLSGCRRLRRRRGFNCDEYPFASSAQGGFGAVIRNVPIRENSRQGGVLAAFYRRNRIGNGDCYRVRLGP